MEKEVNDGVAVEEPFLGFLDIVLLSILLVGALWWFYKKQNKEQQSPSKSYSIQ